jgi:hypothetical protein
MKKTTAAVVATLAAVALGGTALATMDIQKQYKEAHKDSKPNCLTCHVDKMPKKDAHDLNDYGKAVLAAKGKDGKIDWAKVKEPEAKK